MGTKGHECWLNYRSAVSLLALESMFLEIIWERCRRTVAHINIPSIFSRFGKVSQLFVVSDVPIFKKQKKRSEGDLYIVKIIKNRIKANIEENTKTKMKELLEYRNKRFRRHPLRDSSQLNWRGGSNNTYTQRNIEGYLFNKLILGSVDILEFWKQEYLYIWMQSMEIFEHISVKESSFESIGWGIGSIIVIIASHNKMVGFGKWYCRIDSFFWLLCTKNSKGHRYVR